MFIIKNKGVRKMKLKYNPFEPVFDQNSKILILGTIPSPKSIEYGFYYGHPQNRFWKILPIILDEDEPSSIEEKKILLLKHKIALWDVLASCEIRGADDGSIKNPIVNDILPLLNESSIQHVFTTGAVATKLYNRYCYPQVNISTIKLASTSPANCRYYNLEKLTAEYEILNNYI